MKWISARGATGIMTFLMSACSLLALHGMFANVCAGSAAECGVFYTSEPPFYVSSVSDKKQEVLAGQTVRGKTADMATENFKSKEGSKGLLLTRGSIVQIEHADREKIARYINRPDHRGALIPVKVISINDGIQNYIEKGNGAERGAQGYLWSKSMEKGDRAFRYILNTDTTLTLNKGDIKVVETVKAGSTLSPIMLMKNGELKFKAYGCPPEESANPEVLSYFYEALNLPEFDSVEIQMATCDLPDLSPIRPSLHRQLRQLQAAVSETYNAKIGLDVFEYNDFGYVRLPVDTKNYGPHNDYYCYSPGKESCEPTWGKPQVVCSLMMIARRWKQECMTWVSSYADERYNAFERLQNSYNEAEADVSLVKEEGRRPTSAQTSLVSRSKKALDVAREQMEIAQTALENVEGVCMLQLGDLSFVSPGEKSNGRDPLGHTSHSSGSCVDIRLPRYDGVFAGNNIWSSSYFRPLARHLYEFLKGDPVHSKKVLLADPVIRPGVDRMSWAEDHKDHIHLCLDTEEALSHCPEMHD